MLVLLMNHGLFYGRLHGEKGQHITCVGTNTHRLAIKSADPETADDSEYSLLIPARVLKEIANNLTGELPEDVAIIQKTARSWSVWEASALYLVSSKELFLIIQDRFLRLSRIGRFSIARIWNGPFSEFPFCTRGIQHHPSQHRSRSVILSSAASDRGQGMEIMEGVTTGEELPLNIAFNSKYLMDFCKNISCDQVVLETNSSLSPARMMPVDDPSYTYIITPVRVIF